MFNPRTIDKHTETWFDYTKLLQLYYKSYMYIMKYSCSKTTVLIIAERLAAYLIARNVIHFLTSTVYIRKLFTMALGEAMKLQRLLIGALKHHLPPQADGQHRIPE